MTRFVSTLQQNIQQKFLVTKRKTENVGLRFFTKNNNHPTCLYDYLLIHEIKFNAVRSNVVDLVNFWVLFQGFFVMLK